MRVAQQESRQSGHCAKQYSLKRRITKFGCPAASSHSQSASFSTGNFSLIVLFRNGLDVPGWKQLAAAKMCGFALAKLSASSELVGWLNSVDDETWVDACLSPYVSSIVLDTNVEWTQSFAVNETRSLLRSTAEERFPLAQAPRELLPLLRGMGIGTRRSSCTAAEFITPDSQSWVPLREKLKEGLSLIEKIHPIMAADIYDVCACVFLVDEGASFRGASGAAQRGMVFLSPGDDWDAVTFAEELVHESTHCILDLISICTPLFSDKSAYIEEHAAPFRSDPRAQYGNFHAVVVAARCIEFYRCLISADSQYASAASARIAELSMRCRPVYDNLTRSAMTQISWKILEEVKAEYSFSAIAL